MTQIASSNKLAFHRDRLTKYLNQEPIFPVTLELDITRKCNRKCADCPSGQTNSFQGLKLTFIEDLFASLEGQTKGLLLTGGEPTTSSDFSSVLRMAREVGFEDIAVVSNGSLLDQEPIAAALTEWASVVRVSLYDWNGDNSEGFYETLGRIRSLRRKIEKTGSSLEIGVSALTSTERSKLLPKISEAARSSGADWIYFHPTCTNWEAGHPERVDQESILTSIKNYRQGLNGDFEVFLLPERYFDKALSFSAYHAAHFLLVVGADGLNYLGAEVKYRKEHAIADLTSGPLSGFLWEPERLKRICDAESRGYPALGSRHRGVLYSDFIETLKATVSESPVAEDFRFPHIL